MSFLQSLILGVVQGITEFFPISSSGHLIIVQKLMSLPLQELRDFDVAVHFGSLMAIVIYFRKDFSTLYESFFTFLSRSGRQEFFKSEIYYLLVATIPAVVVGLLLNPIFDEYLRSEYLVGILMILTGGYFLLAEKFKIKADDINIIKAIKIGIAQSFAILPGVSRSGVTIATGILIGIDRQSAARFSFLLGSFAIFGATILTGKDIFISGLSISWGSLIIGVIASFMSSFLSIYYLMKLLKTKTLLIFAIYLLLLGGYITVGQHF